MGKKARENFDAITNKQSKNVTSCKRRKGLIKKANELAKLCNLEMLLVIYDQ